MDGGVGVRDHLDRAVVGRDRPQFGVGDADADADRHVELELADRQPAGERAADAIGELHRHRTVGDVVAEHHELVAAEAGDDVVGPDRGREPLGGRRQQPVADLVAERVVDVAEPVDVDHQHGDLAADLRRRWRSALAVRSSAADRLSRPVVGSCSSRCSSSAERIRSSDTSRQITPM